MNLFDQAKADLLQITGNSDEYKSMVFLAPTGETATITGIHAKHNTSVDENGAFANATTAHVSIQESLLTDEDYPVRTSGKVNFKGHKVTVSDSRTSIQYIIREWMPDETFGHIVLILGSL